MTSPKRQPATKLDDAITSAIEAVNSSGPEIQVAEGVCPKCGSPDVDLSFPPEKGLKCWDCGEVYQPFPGWEDMEWQ